MILLDDLGWMDLSCQGSKFYETPNIDRLFQRGMSFDNAYAACPVCSPSRASILSGKYPARLHLTDWIDHGNYHPCKGKLIDAPYINGLPGRQPEGCRVPDLAPGQVASGQKRDLPGKARL